MIADYIIPYTKIFAEPIPSRYPMFFNIKPRPIIVYNDIKDEVVHRLRLLQDREGLKKAVEYFMYNTHAIIDNDSDISSDYSIIYPEDGWDWDRFANMPDWFGPVPAEIIWWVNRVTRAQVDNRKPVEFIKYWDSDETTFYLAMWYLIEMFPNDADSIIEIIDALTGVEGALVIDTPCPPGGEYAMSIYNKVLDRFRGSKMIQLYSSYYNKIECEVIFNDKAVSLFNEQYQQFIQLELVQDEEIAWTSNLVWGEI